MKPFLFALALLTLGFGPPEEPGGWGGGGGQDWMGAPAAPVAPPARMAPSRSPEKKRVYTVAAMGDSLTDPRSHGGKYLDYLRERCPHSRFDSYGKGGNMVNQMRKRFARDVFGDGTKAKRPRYDHVIILGGIADIGSNVTAKRTVAKIESDLGEMYRITHEHGASVIALTVPPWGGFITYDEPRHAMTIELNDWIRRKPANVDNAVDIYPLLSCGEAKKLCPEYGWPDKLHWSKKGHDIVGRALYEALFTDCE